MLLRCLQGFVRVFIKVLGCCFIVVVEEDPRYSGVWYGVGNALNDILLVLAKQHGLLGAVRHISDLCIGGGSCDCRLLLWLPLD